ncbi:MAG: glycosyltransferase family 1 protein [Pseudomonadota bacterium]
MGSTLQPAHASVEASAPVRIHWVSPLPPQATDIAGYTARLLPALAARAEVVLWTGPEGARGAEGAALARHARIRRIDAGGPLPMDLRAFAAQHPAGGRAEAIFVHMGNNAGFHAPLLRFAERVSACLVLHDLSLVDMIGGVVEGGTLPRAAALAGSERWYGATGRAGLEAALDNRPAARWPAGLTREGMYASMPHWELALGRAVSVLTHTETAFEAVAARRAVPSYRLPLPFPIGMPRPPAVRAPDGPLKLVQFGHIWPNRRLLEVLAALARLAPENGQPDPVDFQLDLFGALWDEALVRRHIAERGLTRRVRFHGFVPEARLDAALRAAHLVLNLRQPSVGEASGSQLRIWNAAAASVVTALGWYAHLPEETVFRLPPDGEVSGLPPLLRRLDAARGMGAATGSEGRDRLEALHGTEAYADGIIAIAQTFERDARDKLLAEAARRRLGAPTASREALAAPLPPLMAARAAARLS